MALPYGISTGGSPHKQADLLTFIKLFVVVSGSPDPQVRPNMYPEVKAHDEHISTLYTFLATNETEWQ